MIVRKKARRFVRRKVGEVDEGNYKNNNQGVDLSAEKEKGRWVLVIGTFLEDILGVIVEEVKEMFK